MIKVISKIIKIINMIILLSWFPLCAFSSGTVIGNGGDPLFYFLEATRYSLAETIKLISVDNSEKNSFCLDQKLTQDQIQICRDFFFTTANQILKLNQGPSKTLFVLREENLLVAGPDGNGMPVSARTQLGPDGEIEIHRDSVKLMSPSQTLFLLAHEFNHKVFYNERSLTDNEVIGPFATGRELLDAVAASIVSVAKRKSKIGSQFALRDSFECTVKVNGTPFGVRASSPRMFFSEDLMSYETSLSRNPNDTILFVPETSTSDLVFRAIITEPTNCSDLPKDEAGRQTLMLILRQTKLETNTVREEIVESQVLSGFNPMCNKKASTFALAHSNVQFSCKYFGTSGTTALNQNSLKATARNLSH